LSIQKSARTRDAEYQRDSSVYSINTDFVAI
jgi:hypothetical protein